MMMRVTFAVGVLCTLVCVDCTTLPTTPRAVVEDAGGTHGGGETNRNMNGVDVGAMEDTSGSDGTGASRYDVPNSSGGVADSGITNGNDGLGGGGGRVDLGLDLQKNADANGVGAVGGSLVDSPIGTGGVAGAGGADAADAPVGADGPGDVVGIGGAVDAGGVDGGCDQENACGTCSALTAAPGSPCGTCGTYMCTAAKTAVSCSDPGTNACGGCGSLAAAPGAACGSCGKYVCTTAKTGVSCSDPGLNACGGCGSLAAAPGAACGSCGMYVCTAGNSAVSCSDPGTNACGSCGSLSFTPGANCGSCGGKVQCPDGGCSVGTPVDVGTACGGTCGASGSCGQVGCTFKVGANGNGVCETRITSYAVAVGTNNACGPDCFNGTTCTWETQVTCVTGYSVIACDVSNPGGHGTCTFDNASGDFVGWHGQVSGCDGTHCSLDSCTCFGNPPP